MAYVKQKEEYIDFTALAKEIDSKVDPDFIQLIKQIETWNILSSGLFGNEEFIPVGSCVDGSKVTVPDDSGDLDVLIVSKEIILKEYLFDYDKAFPAFLHIRVNDRHEEYFKTVKAPIDGVYLPAVVLKERRDGSFFLSKMLLPTVGSLTEDGKYLNVTQTSSVGKEWMLLYPDKRNAFDVFMDKPETLQLTLARMEHLAKCILGRMTSTARKCERTAEDGSSTPDKHYRKLTAHDDASLVEMFNNFLDMVECRKTYYSKTRNNLDTNEDRRADVDKNEERGDAMQGTYIDEEGKKIARDYHSESLLYTRKLPREYKTTEVEGNILSSDSKLDNRRKNENAKNLESVEEKKNCSSGEGIKTSPTNSTAKTGVTFSKLQSADFVPAFKFEGWPRVAEEWLTRLRKWPSKVTVKRILELGCQVVAKRPLALYGKPTNEEQDSYFRLSFSLSEVILAQSMKEQQLLCWRVLKAYQKCFLQTRPKFLTSYHWKNVLFWINEDLCESFWTDENVIVAVIKCLDYMEDCLQERNLPFYFVRKMNLFSGCHEMLFEGLRKRVEAIRRQPFMFLKRFLIEPPNSESLFIDAGEIEDILSEEVKAKHMDRKAEEMVNNFFGYIPHFCKSSDLAQQKMDKVIKHFRKISRSKVDGMPSDDSIDAQKSDSSRIEILLDKFEKIMESMKNNGEGEVRKAFDDYFQSMAYDTDFIYKNSIDSEKARIQSFLNECCTLSSGNTNNSISSIHRMLLLVQEGFEATACDKSKGKESKEFSEIVSIVLGSFAKYIEKSTKNKDKTFSETDELRKIINDASQQIGSVKGRKCKTGKKSEMDIDLD